MAIDQNYTTASLPPALTLYYDGNCALCKAEMIYLSARDTEGRLGFMDVRQTEALDTLSGVTCQSALANIHAVTPGGQILIGVQAFQLAYGLVGLKRLSWFLGIRALQPAFGLCYRLFATHRYTLSKVFGGLAMRLVKIITKRDRL
jgi:predicted DCC family thiol-disulfide oxidoreductase YuxK